MIELQQFDGMSQGEVITHLKKLGYERFAEKPKSAFKEKQKPGRQTVFLFRKPGGDHIVEFSRHGALSGIFAEVCRENHGNPFFPAVLSDRKTSAGIHMTVIEDLETAEELGITGPGMARAFATLVDRSRADHAGVYGLLMEDQRAQPWLSEAVSAIAEKLARAFHAGAVPLDYNVRTKEAGPDSGPPCILFRLGKQEGKPDILEGAQPVFVAPFRQAGADRNATERRIRRICEYANVPFPQAA